MHSRILRALLDPKGNHGLGDAFLNAFIEQVGIQDLGLDTKSATVIAEPNIGEIVKEDGRLDLLISSDNKAIIIENKINADDRDGQLCKYHKYGSSYKGGFELIYLTLDGKKASEKSLKNDNDSIKHDQYIRISYLKNITNWLDRCLEISHKQTLVHSTIMQYQSIIKQLTNQTMEEKEFMEVILSGKNAELALQICSRRVSIESKILKNVFEDIFGKPTFPENNSSNDRLSYKVCRSGVSYIVEVNTDAGYDRFYSQLKFEGEIPEDFSRPENMTEKTLSDNNEILFRNIDITKEKCNALEELNKHISECKSAIEDYSKKHKLTMNKTILDKRSQEDGFTAFLKELQQCVEASMKCVIDECIAYGYDSLTDQQQELLVEAIKPYYVAKCECCCEDISWHDMFNAYEEHDGYCSYCHDKLKSA